MSRTVLGLLAAFLAGILAAGGVALWLVGGKTRVALEERGSPAPSPPAEPAIDLRSLSPDQARTLAAELERGQRAGAEPGEEKEKQELPTEIHYTVAEKYADDELSDVPHRLLGAWDDAPKGSAPGRHRSFVLVVDPDLTDQQLEALARDVYRENQDADRLDVRIYDSEEAATGSRLGDGGRYAHAHQVAQVTRHRGLHIDVIRVRGRVVGP